MKIKTWIISIDNMTYNIEFITKFYNKKLLVNNIPIKLERSKTFGISRETTFYIGNKTAILVNIDKNHDVAIDGIYLDSGEKYVSVKKMPLWNYIFLLLVLPIYFFTYTSICSALFTLLCCYFIIRMSIEPTFKLRNRIISCCILTILLHLFFWYVLFLLI